MPGKSKYGERVLNCIPSSGTDRDWGFDNALGAGVLAAPPLPPSVDLRETWWQVGDQLRTGSCVGWATADSVLRWHFVKANKIGTGDLLSVRFIWMAAKETDEWPTPPTTFIEVVGTSLKAALDVARRYGVVSDTLLPFKSGKLYGDDPNTFFATAAQLKIAMYFNLRSDFNRWRSWLATKGPILTRLDVDDTWFNVDKTGNLDVYLPPPPNEPRGHAVAIVGYAAGRFIVRNSWGEGWGDKGFGYASLAYAKAAFSTEAYGVSL
jgi:hypothetical protein